MNRKSGFTLLELATVIVIVLILAALLLPVFASMKRKAQRVSCIANLHSLHTATSQYINEHNHWPQIFYDDDIDKEEADKKFAKDWISALKPYGPTMQTWICPSVQQESENPDLTLEENLRLDYLPTEFSSGPMIPFTFATHPWFVEIGDPHGRGNLIIYPDGSIHELNDLISKK